MKFYFEKKYEEYLFETTKTFEGKTSDITFEDETGLKGKATTRYDGTVRIYGHGVEEVDNVAFYVNLLLILARFGV
jgi:hypothetical protein